MRTFSIPTSQNVAIEYQLATLGDRFFALLLDLIIILVLWIGLLIIGGDLYRFVILFSLIRSFIIWFVFLYNIVSEVVFHGQTLGKRVMKIRVMRADGQPLRWGDSFMRVMLWFVDFVSSLGAVGAFLIISNERRQRLGDIVAQTIVVKLRNKRESALLDNFSNSDIYLRTAVYPQIVQLREDDIVFIKYAIERYNKYSNEAHRDVIFSLYEKVTTLLDIEPSNVSSGEACHFLENLIKDYVVSTR